MYERNAIVIDRYFANIYGYNVNNNIKNNSNNYFELVDVLEKYQDASETENNIMAEFEKIASQIKGTKKLEETLNKKQIKFNENREALFGNLDEDAEILGKQFKKIEEEINKNNEEIKANAERFVEEIKEFHEKSETRSECGKQRRLIENDYQKILKFTTDNFNNISKEKLKEIKTFIKAENKDEAKDQIKEKIAKNGAKEKIPFDTNVISTAIDISTDIEEKKAEVLMSLYDKTMKLLDEIKNDTVKVEKHKKIVKDAKSKLEFLNVISEYIILFLDNERMNSIGGQEEHEKNMLDACEHLQNDLVEIQNMYSLLIKEINGKASKKSYKDLYNLEYLFNLQDEEKRFEQSISKLNMMGTVIYPDYWRLEGMQKIYDTFKHILTDVYEKDLTEYEPLDITFDVKEEVLEIEDDAKTEELEEQTGETENIENEYNEDETDEDEFEDEELEEDVIYEEDEDEFHWDEDDEDDELNFGNNYILDQEEDTEKDQVENDEDEEEDRDKEIDKMLGLFDEEQDEEENQDIEVNDKIFDEEDILIPGLEDEDLNLDEDELTDDIFDDIEEEEKNTKKEEKKKTLFGRRKK